MTTLATNLHDRGYTCYRVQRNGVDEFFVKDTAFLLKVIQSIGTFSPSIFDTNGDGIVLSADYLAYIGGFGQSYTLDFNLGDIEVIDKFSSGWYCKHPLWEAIFIKVTPNDEVDNSYTPDKINTCFIEGKRDGVNYKMWFYVN
jgi:hypothetical protein